MLAGCAVGQQPSATPAPVALPEPAAQPPAPTRTPAPPTTVPSSVSLPTSPIQATSAALFATSTALAATSAAITGNPGEAGAGPARRPRALPNTSGPASPRGALIVLTLVLLTLGVWLRRNVAAR